MERIERMERDQCRSELVIAGVAERPDEDLCSLVFSMGAALWVEIAHSDVLRSFRLGKPSSDPVRTRGILARLSIRDFAIS